MTANAKQEPPNYEDPYSTEYVEPYEIRNSQVSDHPIQILFAETKNLFRACAEPSADRGNLKVAIILPGTLKHFGKSMDAQYLYPVTNRMQTVCERIGLDFEVDAHISWECDDLALERVSNDQIVEKHHLVDLEKYFPDVPRTDDYDKKYNAWVEDCRENMVTQQVHLCYEAKKILSTNNLIVVGGPKVNQVMANLCHIFLLHFKCLGELGMYLVPEAGTLPLKLRRVSPNNKWEEWWDRTWEDRSIGWVHMIRNPWAKRGNPRFLIYIGGFYAQGTPAAMLKLIEIFDAFLGLAKEKDATRTRKLLEHHSDFKIEGGKHEYIPAHVVEAQVEIPLYWFFGALRPGLRASTPLWSITPPAFEGGIAGFKPIPEEERPDESE
jgi:hypothetical protein